MAQYKNVLIIITIYKLKLKETYFAVIRDFFGNKSFYINYVFITEHIVLKKNQSDIFLHKTFNY